MSSIAFQPTQAFRHTPFAVLLLLTGCSPPLDCAAVGAVEMEGLCVYPDGGSAMGAEAGPTDAGDAGDDGQAMEGGRDAASPEAGPDAGSDTGAPPDEDADGVADDEDNCPLASNPEQEDFDGDGLGDVCDPDDDGDGVKDESDACPKGDRGGADQDTDGCVDATEDDDDDNDGIADGDDHCPLVAAPEDVDHDGCPASADACPTGGWVGPDADQDGCLDIEDPSPENGAIPPVPERVYVDASATEQGADGASWSTAHPFLQDGIATANELAADGTPVEVWIATGTYYTDDSSVQPELAGDFTASFEPLSGVRLVGGFEKVDGSWTRSDPTATVLSGDIDQDDDPEIVGRNACHVVGGGDYLEGVDLDGLTIEGGSTWGVLANDECALAASSVLIGGGMLTTGTATLRRVVVRNNHASRGGGLSALGLVATQSQFQGNSGQFGAAVFASFVRAHGTEVTGNYAPHAPSGGAVYAQEATLVNSVLAGNANVEPGPSFGVPLTAETTADLLHVTIVGNTTADPDGSMLRPGSPVQLTNVLAQGNVRWVSAADELDSQTVRTSMIQGAPTDTPGLLVPSPRLNDLIGPTMFVRPVLHTEAPSTSVNLRLRYSEANPAIDAGTQAACPSGAGFAYDWSRMAMPDGTPICVDGKLQIDADGNPRQQGAAVDLGAYELAK